MDDDSDDSTVTNAFGNVQLKCFPSESELANGWISWSSIFTVCFTSTAQTSGKCEDRRRAHSETILLTFVRWLSHRKERLFRGFSFCGSLPHLAPLTHCWRFSHTSQPRGSHPPIVKIRDIGERIIIISGNPCEKHRCFDRYSDVILGTSVVHRGIRIVKVCESNDSDMNDEDLRVKIWCAISTSKTSDQSTKKGGGGVTLEVCK